MPTSPVDPAPIDPAIVQARLRQLLFALLKQNNSCPFQSPEAIPDDVDLSAVGITSIDFLDFALSVEQEFQVAILDTIEPNDLPLTLRAWQQQVCK
ncbi:MAG: acyl carrier protein [Planctomycetes bacterium]|nr:acyl carrier protein [Planctomycetota bacterium]